MFLSPLAPLPCSAAELYSSVLSEAVVDWGSMGPGEDWVNSAAHEGEQGKTQLSPTPPPLDEICKSNAESQEVTSELHC